MINFKCLIKDISMSHCGFFRVQFVLFGFRTQLALHLERSPSIRGYGYESPGVRPGCFASYTMNPESIVQYTGQGA
jgi:hypothetical protein